MLPSTAGPGLEDEEGREHYQRRLATCFGAMAGLMLTFESLVALATMRFFSYVSLYEPGHLVGYTRLLLLLAAWRVCRGRLLGVVSLRTLEVLVTTVVMALTAAPMVLVQADSRADLWAVVVLLMLFSLRAGLVPATPRWTLLVSSFAAAPLVGATALRFVLHEGERTLDWTFLITTSFLCLAAIALTVVVARTIHGLITQVEGVRRLGQYTLEEKIGEGGMGAVYKARHALLRRPAAIKLLRTDRTTEADLARFEREVQLTSQLAHPNTVAIFDYGRTSQGSFYYVMEYLDGFDLDRLVKSHGPLPPARVIRILAQASGALHEAHLRGLVHRDIKPANLILTERADEPDVVKVVDFGLVRAQTQDPDDVDVTGASALIGTPSYLAPEAILSMGSVDARSDLYALGAVGYFLLTGQPVFRGASLVDLCQKHLLEAPVPPSRRAPRPIAADLEAILLACLAKEPAERPSSAEALRRALLACTDADRYDASDARRWWREHGARPQELSPVPAAQTLTIPIELRVPRGRDQTPTIPFRLE